MVAATVQQEIVDAEFTGFGDTPRRKPFATDTVLELGLALNHEHPVAALGHRFRKGGAAETAADGDDVVVRCHRAPSRLVKAPDVHFVEDVPLVGDVCARPRLELVHHVVEDCFGDLPRP